MTRSQTGGHHVEAPRQPGLAILVLLCSIALLFRAAAWLNPSSLVDIPESLALPTSGLGVLYLACAVWVWRSRSKLTGVFLAYGIGGCIHWGGTVASDSAALGTAFAVFYVAGTAMGDAAFLDLALRYPRSLRRRGLRTTAFYLLAILTFIAIPIAPFLPSEIVNSGLGAILMGSLAIAVAGGVVFIVKWFRASPAERREQALTTIVGVLIVTNVISLLADGGVLPGESAAWNLMFGLEPIVLAWAVTRT
ncbi:MAG: hypothetical protein O7D32_06460 [bacterium]|nr:hypothetical protein [bacterium]